MKGSKLALLLDAGKQIWQVDGVAYSLRYGCAYPVKEKSSHYIIAVPIPSHLEGWGAVWMAHREYLERLGGQR